MQEEGGLSSEFWGRAVFWTPVPRMFPSIPSSFPPNRETDFLEKCGPTKVGTRRQAKYGDSGHRDQHTTGTDG